MRILALDTATENCSAALLDDGRLTARELLLERGHAEHILGMIDEVLAAAGASLGGLTAIAYGRGPGAFTGVRLAASVTQGLAFGAGLPVVPVSDLRALAQRLLDLEPATQRVLVCSDARMHEVYLGCFERGAGGLAAAVSEEQVSKPDAVSLPAAWRAAPHSPGFRAMGSGFAAYPALRQAFAGALAEGLEALRPRAAEIALLAAPEVAAGRVLPAEQALPVYLRDDVVRPPAVH
ncbi:MAG TPA: tRNA (adenosine(37)-N6)-threonylcarbamoyltransferase complex dimerization subunit type 1 TsaB [Steroidobacteraceae bacterium]|nr:tRNA (adenosine(37)-N6)-threonylcarbamoyltransferase complex dimerization subunit type 1 TsaB [Steroidobacteraceae bacterium]